MSEEKPANVTMRVRIGESEIEVTGPSDFVEKKIAEFLEKAKQAPLSQSAVSEKGTKPETGGIAQTVGKGMSSAQFFRKVSPKTDLDRVLAAGYFLEKFKEQDSFTSSEIKDAIRGAKIPPPRNTSDSIMRADFKKADLRDIDVKVKQAGDDAKDEVWAGYRFIILSDNQEPDGLKVIDLGAGHSSANETLCGRVITALKSQALLNESVGAGYIDRNWPPALKESGAWPLASLRQSFLNGALTRLLDPDSALRNKIVEFVGKGDFGLASGLKPDGTYERCWFEELISTDEVAFESGVFLLMKVKAKALKSGVKPTPETITKAPIQIEPAGGKRPEIVPAPGPDIQTRTLRLVGTIPPEIWNRLGTKIIPKLKSGTDLKIGVDFSVTLGADSVKNMESDLRQILEDLGLREKIRIE